MTLKEIFVTNKTLVRRRLAPEQNAEVLDHDLNPEVIAQDFIREVVLNRLG